LYSAIPLKRPPATIEKDGKAMCMESHGALEA
jgi:hypothetical protein